MIDFDSCPAVERRPGTLGGVLVFKKTRLPLYVLFDHLADGVTIDDFMDGFPSAGRTAIGQVLQHAADQRREDASSD